MQKTVARRDEEGRGRTVGKGSKSRRKAVYIFPFTGNKNYVIMIASSFRYVWGDLMNHSVFGNAVYIMAEQAPPPYSLYDPLPLFRKTFLLSEEPQAATVFLQAPSFAEVYLNGSPITSDRFISPISDYRKILWYNTYDVTALLKRGSNTLCVITGNGFFNESFESGWHFPTAAWRGAPQFMLSLWVNGELAAVTDQSWRVSKAKSPITYSHLRSGEAVDMRKWEEAFLTEKYDDSSWQLAVERQSPVTGVLRPIHCQPIRELDRIAPTAITQTPGGILVDFGITIAGYAEMVFEAARGTELTLRYAEEVDEQYNPRHNGMDAPPYYTESPFQVERIIASGKRDCYKPHFCYHGFRYLLIEGEIRPESFSALWARFVHQDVARCSDFSSGNEILNFIYEAGLRSTYSNLFWSLTDCPTREKLGWTNDAQASVEQTLINLEILPLYEKWFEDMKASMREDGALPGVIPSPDWGFTYGPVCDGLLFELPFKAWLYTGHTRMLTEAIPYFERYLRFLAHKLDTEETPFYLADWLGYTNSKRIPKRFVQEFFELRALQTTVLAHRLKKTGNTDWSKKLEARTEAFLSHYLTPEGACVFAEQSAIAMMLETGLYRDKAILTDQLLSVLERDAYVLTAGMVGVQYLYDALAHSGRAELAYCLITESEPGYKTWFCNGATTLWERWDGENNGSHNHHMFSGVIAWFYKALLGIAPTVEYPAFEKLELCPSFIPSVGFVRGRMDTVRGRIEAEWRTVEDGFTYLVTIPEGVCATFRDQKLHTGRNAFFVKRKDA